MQRQVNLSPQEAARPSRRLRRAHGVPVRSVRRMLEQARAQRDVVKTLVPQRQAQSDRRRHRAPRRIVVVRSSKPSIRKDSDLGEPRIHDPDRAPAAIEQLGPRPTSASVKKAGFIGETKVTTTIDHQPAEPKTLGISR